MAHKIKSPWVRIPALAAVSAVEAGMAVAIGSTFMTNLDVTALQSAGVAAFGAAASVLYNGVLQLKDYLSATE